MPRAEIPEGVERLEPWPSVADAEKARTDMVACPDGRFVHFADLPAIKAHWLEQLKEELLSDAVVRVAAQAMFNLWGKPGNPTSVDRTEAETAIRAALDSIPIEEGGDGAA